MDNTASLSEFEATLDDFDLNRFRIWREEARRYKTFREFEKGSEWAFDCLNLQGWLGHACDHMSKKKSGFDKSKPGTFYVVSLEGKYEHYIGFGISNDFKSRLVQHKQNAGDHEFWINVLGTMEFESGKELAEFESFLKKNLPICSSGIEGFKRESVEAKDYHLLRKLCRTVLHLPNDVAYHNQHTKNSKVKFVRNAMYFNSYKMSHGLQDILKPKHKITSNASILDYWKRTYSNRYYALMQLLNTPATNRSLFARESYTSLVFPEDVKSFSDQLNYVLEDVCGIHNNWDKMAVLIDSQSFWFSCRIVLGEGADAEVCLEMVGGEWLNKLIDNPLQFETVSPRLNLHELQSYLDLYGLELSRMKLRRFPHINVKDRKYFADTPSRVVDGVEVTDRI